MRGLYRRRRVWWLNLTLDGKRHFISTGETDEARAILAAREIRDRPWDFVAGPAPVESLLALYLAEKERRGISARWREDEGYALRAFFAEAKVENPRQITAAKASEWLASRGPRTAEQYQAILTRFCQWLAVKGRIPSNPLDSLPKVKLRPKARRRFLSQDECRRLIDACQCPDLKAAVMLALHAGLRKGECLAARWSWVDFEAGLLHVQTDADWTPKDRSDRTIPLTSTLSEFLLTRKPENSCKEGYIVRPEKAPGHWRNRWEFRKHFDAALAAAGIEGVTFHDLRRTFASLLVSRGVSVYKVARWLGDGVGVVERHYGHLIAQDDEINRAWT